MNTLDDERALAAQVQTLIDQYGFLLLSDAARETKVPAATLYQAVREERLPAIHLKPHGWLVRLQAIKLAFVGNGGLHKKRGRPKQHQPK